MTWAAVVIFTSVSACDDFNERLALQENYDRQCILLDIQPDGRAPVTSPRPAARPE